MNRYRYLNGYTKPKPQRIKQRSDAEIMAGCKATTTWARGYCDAKYHVPQHVPGVYVNHINMSFIGEGPTDLDAAREMFTHFETYLDNYGHQFTMVQFPEVIPACRDGYEWYIASMQAYWG